MKEYMSDHQVSGKVLPFNPSGEFYFSKGLDSFHKYDFEQARKYLSRALEFEPKHPVITCHLAIVLAEMGEYEQSNELLHKILYELNAYMYECHYFMANNYAYLGMYNKAIKHIKFYLQDAPNGQYARDARELLEVISLESEDFTTSYFETDDLTTEDEIITRQEKSRKLLEQGKTEEAIVLLEEMIKDYPTFWPAHNNLALAYFYEGAIEKAQRIIDRVLEESPGNLHAICNLTVFYFYQGKDIEPYVDMLKKLSQSPVIIVSN